MSNLETEDMTDNEIFAHLKDIAQHSIIQAVFAPTCMTPTPPDATWTVFMNGELLSLTRHDAIVFIAGARAVMLKSDEQKAAS